MKSNHWIAMLCAAAVAVALASNHSNVSRIEVPPPVFSVGKTGQEKPDLFELAKRHQLQQLQQQFQETNAEYGISLHSRRKDRIPIPMYLIPGEEEVVINGYDFMISLRARQRDGAAEALRLAEEARAWVLRDILSTRQDQRENKPTARLVAMHQRFEAELWQIEEQLRTSPRLDQQKELSGQRHELNQELELLGYTPHDISLPQEPPLDTAAIQKLARKTGPLLVYYAAASELWGFLVLPKAAEIYVRSIPISRSALEKKTSAFSHDLANPLYERHAEAQALELWYLLIGPFVDLIPKNGPLVLVPHGPLYELPFEALRDATGKRLFEHWSVSTTPSVSTLASARRRHAATLPGDSFLGFSSGGGLNLPFGEVAEISSFFDTKESAFHPTLATYQNYVERAAEARHLLIATRGIHVEGSRTETYLEIQPTSEVHDSRLTAAEIATIPLKAELVTLAACDTSHGHALFSDERLDLTRSFLIARAAAVLATRWKVPENETTSRFLFDFYRAYRQGGPEGKGMRKDEALTEARRLSRERGDPAQVWAAWVLVGDAR